MATDKPRIMISVSNDTYDRIMKYQEDNHIATKSGAIQSLLELGIRDLFGESLKKEKAPSLSDEAQRIALNYDRLDVHGKEIVSAVISSELRRLDSHKPAAVVKMIPLFGNSFAAGSGEPDFENAWEDFAVPADSPAEFALHVHGDSMEPSLHDGQIVLGVKRKPREGEIGAVLVNGCFYVKEVRRQGRDLLLMSRNRARSDADLYLKADGDDYVKVFGTIIE